MALPLSNYLHGFCYSRYSDIVALTGSYPHIQSQISTQQHTYTYLDTLCSSILVCKLIQRIEFFFLPKDLYHRVKTDYPIGFKYSTSLEEELQTLFVARWSDVTPTMATGSNAFEMTVKLQLDPRMLCVSPSSNPQNLTTVIWCLEGGLEVDKIFPCRNSNRERYTVWNAFFTDIFCVLKSITQFNFC